MKHPAILLFLITSTGCVDGTVPLENVRQDATYPSILLPDFEADSNLDFSIDARPVRIIDAQPDIDIPAVDAAPPIVCERYGQREECEVPGLLGPCSIGEKTCLSTQWTQCISINFPRQEVCDGLDNDCDDDVDEGGDEDGDKDGDEDGDEDGGEDAGEDGDDDGDADDGARTYHADALR